MKRTYYITGYNDSYDEIKTPKYTKYLEIRIKGKCRKCKTIKNIFKTLIIYKGEFGGEFGGEFDTNIKTIYRLCRKCNYPIIGEFMANSKEKAIETFKLWVMAGKI